MSKTASFGSRRSVPALEPLTGRNSDKASAKSREGATATSTLSRREAPSADRERSSEGPIPCPIWSFSSCTLRSLLLSGRPITGLCTVSSGPASMPAVAGRGARHSGHAIPSEQATGEARPSFRAVKLGQHFQQHGMPSCRGAPPTGPRRNDPIENILCGTYCRENEPGCLVFGASSLTLGPRHAIPLRCRKRHRYGSSRVKSERGREGGLRAREPRRTGDRRRSPARSGLLPCLAETAW